MNNCVMATATTNTMTEAEVRALRDLVYGQAANERCWNASRDSWMKPEEIAWLKSQKPHKNL